MSGGISVSQKAESINGSKSALNAVVSLATAITIPKRAKTPSTLVSQIRQKRNVGFVSIDPIPEKWVC